MLNVLAVILCLLIGFVTVLILFIFSDRVKERKDQQKYAIELLERLKLKVFLLKADLTEFTERNNLLHVDFYYNFTFYDCIASLTRVESKVTDRDLLFVLKTSGRETQINSIISDCKFWMLHIDRISYSFDKKSSNPVYNKELKAVVQKLTQLNAAGKKLFSIT